MVGPNDTPMILQIKEATRSVLEEYGGWRQPDTLTAAVEAKGQGVRVIDGQRILQAMSDVFLGTTRKDGHDYYVRQFHDMKGTIDTEGMSASTFGKYVTACAVLLARAHSQSANASILRGYVGTNDTVHGAVAEWSLRIRRQVARRLSPTARGCRGGRHRSRRRSWPLAVRHAVRSATPRERRARSRRARPVPTCPTGRASRRAATARHHRTPWARWAAPSA